MSSKAKPVNSHIEQQKARQNREERDHKAEKAVWKENGGDAKEIVFNVDSTSAPTSSTCDQLESMVELAKLKTLLFEQQLRIKKGMEAISIE